MCPHHLKTLVHSGLGLTPQKNCSLTESPYIHSTLSFRRGLGSKELRLSLSGVKLYEAVRLVLSTMFRWKIQFALSVFSMMMTCTQHSNNFHRQRDCLFIKRNYYSVALSQFVTTPMVSLCDYILNLFRFPIGYPSRQSLASSCVPTTRASKKGKRDKLTMRWELVTMRKEGVTVG